MVGFILLAPLAMVQVDFEVSSPFEAQGIRLIPSTSLEFPSFLAKLGRLANLAPIEPFWPLSAILVNSSNSIYLGYTIRYEMVNARGAPVVAVGRYYWLEPEQISWRFKPGDCRLASVLLNIAGESVHGTFSEAGLAAANKNFVFYQGMASITAKLDSLITDDGTVIGPDVSRTYETLALEYAARRAVVSETQLLLQSGASDDEVTASLKTKAAARASGNLGRDVGAVAQARMAEALIGILRSRGSGSLRDFVDANLRRPLISEFLKKGQPK